MPRFWVNSLSFPPCRCILMHLQQTTSKNSVHKKKLLLMSNFSLCQHFQIFSLIIFSFIEIFNIFAYIFSKLTIASLVCGKCIKEYVCFSYRPNCRTGQKVRGSGGCVPLPSRVELPCDERRKMA